MTTTTSTFDEEALAALPPVPAFVDGLRRTAFERFVAMPIPSQDTEEWRYTDLSNFDLGFVPHTPGHGGPVPEQSGNLGGAMVQHNSSVAMTTSDQDVARRGVIFCDLDLAAEKHPDLVRPHLHALVPPIERSSPPCTAPSARAAPSCTFPRMCLSSFRCRP